MPAVQDHTPDCTDNHLQALTATICLTYTHDDHLPALHMTPQAQRLVTSYSDAVNVPINGSGVNGTNPVHLYALSLYDDGSKVS